MKSVFLSYRHTDSRWVGTIAQRLYDELALGDLFWDRDNRSLPGATKWLDGIDQAVEECLAMVVAVGRHWFGDESNGRRIDRKDDTVRHEVALGLQTDITIIPVVARDVKSRLQDEPLPADIAPLLRWQLTVLSDPPSSDEIDLLLTGLVDTVVVGRRTALKTFTLGEAMRSSRLDDMIATARIAGRRDSMDAVALRALGAGCLARYDYPAAVEALTRALHIDPSDVESRYLYAVALLRGRAPSSMSDTEVATILAILAPGGRPLDDVPHHRALQALIKWGYYVPRQRDPRGAESDFMHAQRAHPQDIEIDTLIHLPSFRDSVLAARLETTGHTDE
jgi:hypothetical protein